MSLSSIINKNLSEVSWANLEVNSITANSLSALDNGSFYLTVAADFELPVYTEPLPRGTTTIKLANPGASPQAYIYNPNNTFSLGDAPYGSITINKSGVYQLSLNLGNITCTTQGSGDLGNISIQVTKVGITNPIVYTSPSSKTTGFVVDNTASCNILANVSLQAGDIVKVVYTPVTDSTAIFQIKQNVSGVIGVVSTFSLTKL